MPETKGTMDFFTISNMLDSLQVSSCQFKIWSISKKLMRKVIQVESLSSKWAKNPNQKVN